jgi:hypothetical protein
LVSFEDGRPQDAVAGTEVFEDVGADVVADRIRIPAGASQQPLHLPEAGETGMVGQTPAVLPLDAGQQGEHGGAGRRPRLQPR